jgi:hypothetical protein
MQYLALTDAMGYQAGPQCLSPEEYAEALRQDAEKWRQVGAPIADEHRAELEALSVAAEQAHQRLIKDAARYRWLADNCDGNEQDDFRMWLGKAVYSRQEIDARIDAAMVPKRDGAA